jgi:hypothetical protein
MYLVLVPFYLPSRVLRKTLALFSQLIIRTFQLVFSVGIAFFSRKKSARTVFHLVFQLKRMGPLKATSVGSNLGPLTLSLRLHGAKQSTSKESFKGETQNSTVFNRGKQNKGKMHSLNLEYEGSSSKI